MNYTAKSIQSHIQIIKFRCFSHFHGQRFYKIKHRYANCFYKQWWKNGLLSGARWIPVWFCDNSLRFPYAPVTWRVLTISQSKNHKKHVANLLWKNLRSLYRVVIWSDKTLFRWIGGQTASQVFLSNISVWSHKCEKSVWHIVYVVLAEHEMKCF